MMKPEAKLSMIFSSTLVIASNSTDVSTTFTIYTSTEADFRTSATEAIQLLSLLIV